MKTITANYNNPEFVEAVEAGLRATGRLDAEIRFVNEQNQLVFEDAVGNQVIFEAFNS